jgi:S1-C subfamily serine protease
MEKRFLYVIYLIYKRRMRRHHKWAIGGFGTVVLIFMLVSGILLNGVIVKQTVDYNTLNNRIINLQADTQNKLNELTENIIETQTTVEESQEELNQLKASVGEDFSGIIEDSIPLVVTIRTDIGQGTGFIINEEGYIVTNAHVLAGGRKIQAITSEQKLMDAIFIGYNIDFDIALLKIPGEYEAIELGDSEDIQIGEKVIAIGNPLGLQFSVSEGIVSGIHREGINGIEAYIQTDAALNPGNSGGPLINKQGEVIGINNFKIGDSESLGFALESNYIEDIVNDISQEELNRTLIS